MFILTEFVLRLSFGLALGMALTNSRQVTSGYYRNHLYVLLGLNVLATMVALAARDQFALAPPLSAAVLSYVGSVVWLYEKHRAGRLVLAIIAAVTLWGAWAATPWPHDQGTVSLVIAALDPLTGGLVLGITMAAMFLGHWYLNTPTMAIGPLKKLVRLMAVSLCLRAIVEGVRLVFALTTTNSPDTQLLLFVALRWFSGIIGALGLALMTYKTLEIPNTQSATGILYVAVIVTFLGELVSLLLTAQSTYPI